MVGHGPPQPQGTSLTGCPSCSYLTRISWMSGTSKRWGSFSSSGRRAGDFFCSPSTAGSRSGLSALEEIWGGLGKEERLGCRKSDGWGTPVDQDCIPVVQLPCSGDATSSPERPVHLLT